jgi:hypothetical protein
MPTPTAWTTEAQRILSRKEEPAMPAKMSGEPSMTPPPEPERATVLVAMSPELVAALTAQGWEFGEPDESGFYSPIVRAAAAPLREALRDVLDHSIPQHSSACAAQDEDDDCICETGPLMDRAYAALTATPAPAPLDVDLIEQTMNEQHEAVQGSPIAPRVTRLLAEDFARRYARNAARAAGTEDTNDPTA